MTSAHANPTIRALDLWHQVMSRHVRGAPPDLTSRQMAILLEIYLNTDRPHTVRGLAQSLNLSKPVVTRALDTMSRRGFVRRKRDEADRRNVFLHRTVKGTTYLADFASLIVAAEKDIDSAAPADPA